MPAPAETEEGEVPVERTKSTIFHDESVRNADLSELLDAYAASDAANLKLGWHGEHVATYNPIRLSTTMLFFTIHGTVLRSWVLWVETLLLIIIFIASWTATTLTGYDNEELTGGSKRFIGKLSMLATFLLGFYTSEIVSRWWTMRTDGVGKTWGAMRNLSFWIPECVTRDREVNHHIHRYARASLCIAFLEHRSKGFRLEQLVRLELLTSEEVCKLKQAGSNYAKVLWSWVAAIIWRLMKNKSIQCDNVFAMLMSEVSNGRNGIEVIGTYMGTPVPLPYVHLLGVMVKIHNIVLALLYGFTMASCNCQHVFNVLKVLIIPFFFNALLLINAELMDPLGGDVNDFPLKDYQNKMEEEANAFYRCRENRPDWMKKNANLQYRPPKYGRYSFWP
jgi:predicted membrane chloride channel (bestrophin family)